MIELIHDLPDHVVGLRASGKITGEDYERVLIPALETAFKKTEKVNLIYLLADDLEGFDMAAMWSDAKIGLEHFFDFQRIAVVCDTLWIQNFVKAFGFLMPAETRVFPLMGFEAAQAWITE